MLRKKKYSSTVHESKFNENFKEEVIGYRDFLLEHGLYDLYNEDNDLNMEFDLMELKTQLKK